MKRNQAVVNTLFIVIFLVCIDAAAVGSNDDNQPSLAGNDYILRSCMSTAELSRRNANRSKPKSPIILDNPRSRTVTFSALRSPLFSYSGKSVDKKIRGRSREKLEERVHIRGRPSRKMIDDTPLKTVNVERRGRNNDGPQIFVKKDLLPLLERAVPVESKYTKNDASIIVIESTPR